MKTRPCNFLLLFCCFIQVSAISQSREFQPIKWTFTTLPLDKGEAKLIFTCNLEDGWHVFSQFMEEGGPLPTSFRFVADRSYSLEGKVVEESKPTKEYDSVFLMPIVWYKGTAIFSQRVKLHNPVATVKGSVAFMSCNGAMCLPPEEIDFSVEVKGTGQKNSKRK